MISAAAFCGGGRTFQRPSCLRPLGVGKRESPACGTKERLPGTRACDRTPPCLCHWAAQRLWEGTGWLRPTRQRGFLSCAAPVV